MPFPDKGIKVEEMFDWVVEEVISVPETVWWLNDNFIILDIECILSMLDGEGFWELGRLHDLVTSHDATVLEAGRTDCMEVVETSWLAWGSS
jgi:hypothetical protein